MASAFSNSADVAPGRFRARLVLLLFLLVAVLFIGVTFSPLKSGFADAPDRGPGDIALYQAEAACVHEGQSYYAAASAEPAKRG